MALSILKTVKDTARRKWIPFYSLKRNHRAWYSVLLIIWQNTLNENARLIKTLIIYVLFIYKYGSWTQASNLHLLQCSRLYCWVTWKPIHMHEKSENESASHSVVWLFATIWTAAHQVFLFVDFSKEDTGMGSHSLLQGMFLTQELNLLLQYFK